MLNLCDFLHVVMWDLPFIWLSYYGNMGGYMMIMMILAWFLLFFHCTTEPVFLLYFLGCKSKGHCHVNLTIQKVSLWSHSQKYVTVIQQNIDITKQWCIEMTKPQYDDTMKQWYGWLVCANGRTLCIFKRSVPIWSLWHINMYINPITYSAFM